MSDKFVVTFYDDDEETILDEQVVESGASVEYQGPKPEKDSVNGIQYTFVGWDTIGDIKNVTEDIALIAKYEEGSKATAKDDMYALSQANAENARLNEVMDAGKKVDKAERATRDMTLEEKSALVNEIIDKGSVDLDKETENERD